MLPGMLCWLTGGVLGTGTEKCPESPVDVPSITAMLLGDVSCSTVVTFPEISLHQGNPDTEQGFPFPEDVFQDVIPGRIVVGIFFLSMEALFGTTTARSGAEDKSVTVPVAEILTETGGRVVARGILPVVVILTETGGRVTAGCCLPLWEILTETGGRVVAGCLAVAAIVTETGGGATCCLLIEAILTEAGGGRGRAG